MRSDNMSRVSSSTSFPWTMLFLMIAFSSCMADQFQRQGVFRRVTSGGRLTSDVLSSHKVQSMMDCGLQCLHNEICAGINYRAANKKDEQNCQLTTKDAEPEKYEQETNDDHDWTFYKTLDISPLQCPSNFCKNGGQCLPNPGQPDGFSCNCSVRYRGKICEIGKVFKSCKSVLDVSSEAKDGVYKIKTNTTSGYTKVYCQMTSLRGCTGRGWTMVMKINGSKDTFVYSSNYWSNNQSYNPSGGLTAFDDQETKLATYHSTSFKELCVGMKVANNLKFVSISYSASSLYSLISDNITRSTNLSRQKWKSLIVNSSLQQYCNKEGFNIKPGSHESAYVRIGILANDVWDCRHLPDSFIGFGGTSFTYHWCNFQPSLNSCGNVAGCEADNGDADIKAMGYIFIR